MIITQRLQETLKIIAQTNPDQARTINEELNSILNRVMNLLNNKEADIKDKQRLIDDINLSLATKKLELESREEIIVAREKRLQRRVELLSHNDII
jgi:uncharacterized protein (DUF3084 family)